MAGMMNSGASFLPRANEKFESNSQPSETDVVERSPDNRYIRYNEILGRGAFKTVYGS